MKACVFNKVKKNINDFTYFITSSQARTLSLLKPKVLCFYVMCVLNVNGVIL